MPAKTLVIVNPHSAGGTTGRRWPEVETRLRETLGDLEVQRTLGRRDAERIASEAVRTGVQRLVVAGGDGTASEVTSGLLASGLAASAQVGIVPMGTGRDFPRTLGTPLAIDEAIEALGRGATRVLDAMRVRYRDPAGGERTCHAINVTSLGLSGLTVQLVSSVPVFGGSLAFGVGAVASILRYRAAEVEIRADGEVVCAGPVTFAAVANGRFFGGGMQVAPDARPDDGLLDLVIVRQMSKLDLIASLPSLYRGTHVARESVSVHRVKQVSARPLPGLERPVYIDVDGEALGSLPFEVEVLPAAVTFFGCG